MKSLIGFILVQVAVVFALIVWRPAHRETPGTGRDFSPSALAAVGTGPLISPRSPDLHRRNVDPASESISTVSANRNSNLSAPLEPAANYKSDLNSVTSPADIVARPMATAGRMAGGRQSKDADRQTPAEVMVLPVPTAEQMEQTLAVPLAFLAPPVEAGLTGAEVTDLAEIAKQFNATVGAAGQDPSDPVYAQTYYDARKVADEQVWAIAGQTAYMALINQRAQAAGNVPPGH
jgi:hypothetical protein